MFCTFLLSTSQGMLRPQGGYRPGSFASRSSLRGVGKGGVKKPWAFRLFEVAIWIAAICLGVGAFLLWPWPRILRVQSSEHGVRAHSTSLSDFDGSPASDLHHSAARPALWDLRSEALESVKYLRKGAKGIGGSSGGEVGENGLVVAAPAAAQAVKPFCKIERPRLCGPPIPIVDAIKVLSPDDVNPDEVKCHWTHLSYTELPEEPALKVCTYDPERDRTVSQPLHENHKWIGDLEWAVLRALGPCTAEKPFMIEVGASLGTVPIMLAAARGCHVIAIEPIYESAARLAQSVAANGLSDKVTIIHNAAHAFGCNVVMYWNQENPGAGRVVELAPPDTRAETTARAISLEALFSWQNRPKHPKTGKPMALKDVRMVRVAAEGYDLAILHPLLNHFGGGSSSDNFPLVSLQFYAALSNGDLGCSPRLFIDALYAKGYKMYLHFDLWPKPRWNKFLETETWSAQTILIHESIPLDDASGGLPPQFKAWDSDAEALAIAAKEEAEKAALGGQEEEKKGGGAPSPPPHVVPDEAQYDPNEEVLHH